MKENKKDKKTDNKLTKEQELAKVIAELKEKNLELENSWKRALADYKNFQTRIDENRSQEIKYLKISIINQLLPTIDHLEMHCKFSEDASIEMIRKEFVNALATMEVYEIEALGKEFDAKTMDAIEIIEGEKDKVIEITRKGYILNNTIIRPAQVKVGNGNIN